MIHITNGDEAAKQIRATGIPGEVIAWRDLLHEGPVPSLSLTELSEKRAEFISQQGWAKRDQVRDDFAKRDQRLVRAVDGEKAEDELVLWFEHDLYDQLQLVQILDWLARNRGKAKQTIIEISEFPGVKPFHGLGQLTPENLKTLFPKRREVTEKMRQEARAAWEAFTAPEPVGLANLSAAELRHLRSAVGRLLEEFPGVRDGLSRTEREVLQVLANASRDRRELFADLNEKETAPFLGDTTFFSYLDRLARCRVPLVKLNGEKVELTPAGRTVLSGRSDHVVLNGIDRWIGGTHLHDRLWRWDGKQLVED